MGMQVPALAISTCFAPGISPVFRLNCGDWPSGNNSLGTVNIELFLRQNKRKL